MKRVILFLLLVTSINSAYSFFLMSDSPKDYLYTGGEIKVKIISAGCTNAGLTSADLERFAQEALDDFWNGVASADIEFIVDGKITLATTLTTSEILDATTWNEITVACSSNATLFEADTSALAVGGYATSGGRIKGHVTINSNSTTPFPSQTELNKKAVFAHEFGHAIGIGHSSLTYALMYYSVSASVIQERLSQDDADALTFLYPHDKKLGGLAGSCGTVDIVGNGGGGGSGPLGLLLGIATVYLLMMALRRVRKINIA